MQSLTLCIITSFIGLYDVELLDLAFTFFSFDLKTLFSALQFDFCCFYYHSSQTEHSHCSDQPLKRKSISEMLNSYFFFLWKVEI